MICLAIAGSLVAGAHYYTVTLPAQNAALHPPANDAGDSITNCKVCRINCIGSEIPNLCLSQCDVVC
jgi:hypothetical protein